MRNYTRFDEIKELIKAGLDPNTADMHIVIRETEKGGYYETSLCYSKWDAVHIEGYLPCWSLGALIDLMPLNILDKENVLQPRQIIGNDVYYDNICYFNNKYGLFSNVVGCICWLLENGYIKKEL